MERLADRLGDLAGIGDEHVVLRDRHRDAGDVGLLERVVAHDRGRDLAGDRDHGDRVHLGVGERGDQVAAAGTATSPCDADLAGRPRVALGGVAGALLVAAQHVPDARVEQRVVGRQDGAAGDAEDDVDALALEGLEQRLRAGDLHLAATSSVRASTGPVSTRFTVADRRWDRLRQARSNSHGVQSRRRICSTSSR